MRLAHNTKVLHLMVLCALFSGCSGDRTQVRPDQVKAEIKAYLEQEMAVFKEDVAQAAEDEITRIRNKMERGSQPRAGTITYHDGKQERFSAIAGIRYSVSTIMNPDNPLASGAVHAYGSVPGALVLEKAGDASREILIPFVSLAEVKLTEQTGEHGTVDSLAVEVTQLAGAREEFLCRDKFHILVYAVGSVVGERRKWHDLRGEAPYRHRTNPDAPLRSLTITFD